MAGAPAHIRALRWHGRGDLRLESIPKPEPPPGCSLIDVSACGICGTDLHEVRDGPHLIRTRPHALTGQAPPVTLGHELSGVIRVAGRDAPFPPGARVTADACWRCGACEQCLAGDYHLCRYGGSIGLHSDGAFADSVVVPDYCLVALPDEVSDHAGALTEPFAVGLHALDRGGARPGDDVLVLGFGPIGAACALTARALGARPHVVELSEERASVASELGLPLIAPGDDVPRRARSELGGGGADVVIEATGASGVLADAIESARRGGRIVAVGMGAAPVPVDLDRLLLFERSLVGSLGYRHDLPRIVRMVSDGLIDPTVIVDRVVPLSEGERIFGELVASPGKSLKVLVEGDG